MGGTEAFENEAEYIPRFEVGCGPAAAGAGGEVRRCGSVWREVGPGGRAPLKAEDRRDAVVGETVRSLVDPFTAGRAPATSVGSRVRLCASRDPDSARGLPESFAGQDASAKADMDRSPIVGAGRADVPFAPFETGLPAARSRSAGTEFDTESKADRLEGPRWEGWRWWPPEDAA